MLRKRLFLSICWLLLTAGAGVVYGQSLCKGVTGEKFKVTDFGAAGPGGPLYSSKTPKDFGFTTTYKPKDPGSTQDGHYSIMNNPQLDIANWVTGDDHTPGDQNGYMFLVNADFSPPNEFYRDTIKNLCIGNRYEFSAWAANVILNGGGKKEPDILFDIRSLTNIRIDSLQTNAILASPTQTMDWKQYGLSFTATTTSIILLMKSKALGGDGNDIVIDDIAFTSCNPLITIPKPIIPVCANATAEVKVEVKNNPNYGYYQWQTSTDGNTWTNVGTFGNQLTDLNDYTLTLPVPNVKMSQDGQQYRVVVAATEANIKDPNSKCNVFSPVSELEVLPSPELKITLPVAPCGTAQVDLTAASIYAGTVTNTGLYHYYNTEADLLAETNEVNPATLKAVAASKKIYVLLKMPADPKCSDTASVAVTVNAKPTLTVIPPAAVCAPSKVDITLPAVLTVADLGTGSVSYHSTLTDATLNKNALAPASAKAIDKTGKIYYRASTSPSSPCPTIDSVVVTIHPEVILKITSPPAVCSPQFLDLTLPSLFTGTIPANASLTYFPTKNDALAGSNAIPGGSLSALLSSKKVWVKASTATMPSCSDTGTIEAIIHQKPVLVKNDPPGACSPAEIDLTANSVISVTNLLGGQVTYHSSKPAAQNGTSPLAAALVKAYSTSGKVYVRAAVEPTTPCPAIDSVTVTVQQTPKLVLTPPPAVCGPAILDLTQAKYTAGSTLYGQPVLFYRTDADRQAGLRRVSTATLREVENSVKYFLKVTSPAGALPVCQDTSSMLVLIHETPVITVKNPDPVCSPGTADLTMLVSTTVGGLTFHQTRTDALTGANSQPASRYKGLVKNDSVYYRALTATIPACVSIDSAIAYVNEAPALKITLPPAVCSPLTVDLTQPAVTAGSKLFDPIVYYGDFNEAINGVKPIAPGSLTKLKSSGTYFIKAIHAGNPVCSIVEPVRVTVHDKPVAAFTGLLSDYCQNIPLSVPLTPSPKGGVFTGTGMKDSIFSTAVLGSYKITYRVQDVNNCKDEIQKTVTVHPNPVVSFTGLDPFYCSKDSSILLKGSPSGGIFTGSPSLTGSFLSLKTPGDFIINYSYSDAFGCKGSAEKPVTILQTIDDSVFIKDTTLCEGSSFLKRSPVVASFYQWEPLHATTSSVQVTPKKTDNYTFVARTPSECATYRGKFTVTFVPTPPYPLEGPVKHCFDDGPLELLPLWGTTFKWSDGSSMPAFNVPDYGFYGLRAYDKNFCFNEKTIEVINNCPPQFYVPTAFSPNGDSENDIMGLYGKHFRNLKLEVFNRWGELIYYTSDRNLQWDGTYRGEPMPIGVYNWQATYESLQENDPDNPRKKSGSITLIR